jgi:hypothetical protein
MKLYLKKYANKHAQGFSAYTILRSFKIFLINIIWFEVTLAAWSLLVVDDIDDILAIELIT